jgi:DNA-binding response OmpR family regulator
MAKKIMIVEDDSFVMDIYHTKLEQENFEVIEASNGVEAMKKLQNITPDLMLLDIIMPYMDGLELLKKVKDDDRLKSMPIILLTNLSQKEEVNKGLGLGANDYLIKSHFTPSEVLEKIKNYISNK